jgi:tetratricopeptide (TPR) repeat protein
MQSKEPIMPVSQPATIETIKILTRLLAPTGEPLELTACTNIETWRNVLMHQDFPIQYQAARFAALSLPEATNTIPSQSILIDFSTAPSQSVNSIIYYALAKIYKTLRIYEKSKEYLIESLHCDTSNFDAYILLAQIEESQKFYEQAKKYYLTALDILYTKKNNSYAQERIVHTKLFLALNLLKQNDLKDGWKLALEKFNLPNWRTLITDRYKTALWHGEHLHDQAILLFNTDGSGNGKIGIGDTVMFTRYANALHLEYPRATIHVETHNALIPILSPTYPNITFVPTPQQHYDYCFPLTSIPAYLPTNAYATHNTLNLPTSQNPPKGKNSVFTIGFWWQGNPTLTIDAERSIQLQKFLPLLDHQKTNFIILQQNTGRNQIETLNLPRTNVTVTPPTTTLLQTTTIMNQCDLLIGTDTGLAHLAGALNKRTALLLSYDAEWRWQTHPKRSIFYQSLRLYRQTKPGDWDTPIDQIKRLIERLTR